MGSEGVIEKDRNGNYYEDVENTVFVAVGKNVKESRLVISWVLKCFGGSGKKICLLHVHQPLHLVTLLDGKLAPSKLKQHAVKVCRELERQRLHKLLNQYLLILSKSMVQGDKLWIEMDNVEKGIVQTVARYSIKWLVMGAATEKQYSREMSELKSNKAIYVCQHTPDSCHIWFTCKGCLIYTRERSANVNSNVGSIVAMSSPISAKHTSFSHSHSSNDNTFKWFEHSKSPPLLMNSIEEKGLPLLSPHDSAGLLFSSSSIMVLDENSQGQSSGNLHDKLDLAMIDAENSRPEAFQVAVKQWKAEEDAIDVLCLDEKSQGQSSGNLHDKLDHAMKDAENARKEAFQKAVKRWKAEEDAIDALRIAEASESSWKKEATQRKEMEETLAKQRQELKNMINQRNECIEKLQMVREQNAVLETRIRKSHDMEELEEKIIQAVNLLITFKERRDQLREDRDNAIVETNQLRRLVEKESPGLCRAQFLTPSFFEIIGATQDFDPSMKIGEGRYGSVYKGHLHHVKVAIKMLPSVGSQSDAEFKHEVENLSRVRHPNLVMLIGTCPESRSLILEYLENGSLEDHLGQQVKTPSLPWKTRINIAVEICSALIFLHSNKPPLIHGDLKLTNILFDKNYVSKLSDLGIYRLIPACKTDKEVSAYMGPEILVSDELTVYSDIYSFGIVLLQILTGRPPSGVLRDVKCAVENGNFSTILDSSAGDWPIKQAKELAELALRCCEKNPLDQLDLVSDVLPAIEPMRDLCTTILPQEPEGHRRVPSYFLCPIFQEVMKDPYIAADGFTYEADAIKGWLNSGHKTSPMTNLKLEHCGLLPNSALYYAIQEWMQQP